MSVYSCLYILESENGYKLKVCIGTDSQVKGAITDFATVIVLLREHHGGFMYIHQEKSSQQVSIKERMLMEVQKSIETAYSICDLLDIYDVALEVHADINTSPQFKSNKALNDAMGYILSMGFIFTNPIIALLLYLSIITALLFRKRHDIILLIWFFANFIFFSFFAGEKDPRYITGLLPAGVLLISLSLYRTKLIIEQLGKLKLSNFILIALLFIFALSTGYSQTENFIKAKTTSYLGYQEAGKWLKQNTEPNAIFYMATGTARQIRLFSQIEFDQWGGRIHGLQATKEEFYEKTKSENRPIYIIQDMWEFTQPGWIYPINQEKVSYLENISFVPVKTAQRKLNTPQGQIDAPAVIVFKRLGLPT